MADTGWIRFSAVQTLDWDFFTVLQSGNTGTSTSTRNAKNLILATFTSGIGEFDTITGISFRFEGKYTGTGTTPQLRVTPNSGGTNGDATTSTLGTSNTVFTIGGDGNLLGLDGIITGANIDALQFILYTINPDNLTLSLEGSEADLMPAVKIFYTENTDFEATDWKRWGAVDSDSEDWSAGSATDLLSGQSNNDVIWQNPTTLPYIIFSSPDDFGVPSDATITGLEFQNIIQPNSFVQLATDQIWKIKTSLSSITAGDITEDYFTETPGASNTTVQSFTTGSSDNTFGLSLTPSNLTNLKVGIKCTDLGGNTLGNPIFTYGSIFGGIGNLNSPRDVPHPSVRVFYTTPEPPPPTPTVDVFRPGPNFMSSNVDLTRFRGLGDKTSPLATPPASEDLFGFTSTIVPEGDNSSQATNSVFGDAANFGKLGLNRGGGTGISSDTGLLDTSKAPLSVRKGFRGI